MTTEEISSQRHRLIRIIDESKKDLKELQDLCKHSTYSVVTHDEDGRRSIKNVCGCCGRDLGYPSDQDFIDAGMVEDKNTNN